MIQLKVFLLILENNPFKPEELHRNGKSGITNIIKEQFLQCNPYTPDSEKESEDDPQGWSCQ